MRDGNHIALVELFQRVAVLQMWLQISHKVLAEVMIWFRKRLYLNIIQKDTEHNTLRHPPWHEGNHFFYIDLSLWLFSSMELGCTQLLSVAFFKLQPKEVNVFIKVSDLHLWHWSRTPSNDLFKKNQLCENFTCCHSLRHYLLHLPGLQAWSIYHYYFAF